METYKRLLGDRILIGLMLLAIVLLVMLSQQVFPGDFFHEVSNSFASSLNNFNNGVASN